jgi:spermidine/putrescine transport system substrate-binding protein
MDTSFTRRRMLKAAAAAALAAPAIIGRANLATAQASFAGERLSVVAWSGNYQDIFNRLVVEPFNEEFGTSVETQGGWDQMVSQLVAAPADQPPFDITITDEYTTVSGMAEGVFAKTDRAVLPNLSAVYPWYLETRPLDLQDYGAPFGAGTGMLLVNKRVRDMPMSWSSFWAPEVRGLTTMDAAAFYWSLSVPAILSSGLPGLDEIYDWPNRVEPLIADLAKLQMAKWYKDGAEMASLIYQDEVALSFIYGSDGYGFYAEGAGDYTIGVPKEGTGAWTEWFIKTRGTQHGDLADVFLNYLLRKDVQDRFLSNSMTLVSRRDVVVPAHWTTYPRSNEDYHKALNLISIEGWNRMFVNYEAMDVAFKKLVTG